MKLHSTYREAIIANPFADEIRALMITNRFEMQRALLTQKLLDFSLPLEFL